MTPKLDEWYKASDLPSGSVVGASTGTQYVIGRSGCCMRWEQPIPGSETWRVRYEGRLPDGVWMTPRERAEVDEVRPAQNVPFGFHPDPVMRDIYVKVLDIEVLAGQLFLVTDGAVESTDAYDSIEAGLRDIRSDLVVLHQRRVPADEEEDE